MRHRFAAIALSFVLLALTVSAATAGERDAIARGDSAYARLDNATAVAAYDEAVRSVTGPLSFELLARLARTLNDHGLDLAAAKRDAEAEATLERAIKYAEELSERFPNRPESWFLLAAGKGNLALYKGGRGKVRLGRAVEEYCLRAIEVDPGFPYSYTILGIFYRELAELNWVERTVANTLFGGLPAGSLEKSEAMLQRALALDDAAPLSHFELGRTLLRLGRPDEAREHLELAIRLKPMTTLDVRDAAEARRLIDGL